MGIGRTLKLPLMRISQLTIQARPNASLVSRRTKCEPRGETLIEESRRSFTMDVFGALEAAFQVDFLQRCYGREKDPVSRAFRDLYHHKGSRVSLESDILAAWRQNSNVRPRVIADLSSALKYRHWLLAHGRYWSPKFPKLDYYEVYTLAGATLDAFPFRGTAKTRRVATRLGSLPTARWFR